MIGFDVQDALRYLLSRIQPKAFSAISAEIPVIIQSFLTYDLRFMQISGALDEHGNSGENEYDEDEAFEYIFEAYLADFPCDDDTAMIVASLLDCYMELQYEYCKQHGLLNND